MSSQLNDDRDDPVRLEECPFCGAEIEAKAPPFHLEECTEFFRAFDVDPPTERADSTNRSSTKNGRSRSQIGSSETIQPARTAGIWVGRPPSGFTVVDGQLRVDVPTFGAIVEAFERIEAGESQRTVSREIDVVHESTLRRLYADDERRQIYTEHRAPNERIQAALDGWLEAVGKDCSGE